MKPELFFSAQMQFDLSQIKLKDRILSWVPPTKLHIDLEILLILIVLRNLSTHSLRIFLRIMYNY